jgi:ATP/maltotriose-dependent transcriptional regulator MalT
VFRSEQQNDTAHLRIEIVVQTSAWATPANLNVRQRPRCRRRRGAGLLHRFAFEESDVEVNLMRVFWETVGVLGPVYRLVGKGLSDRDIARKLNLTELSVQTCIAWILHFLGLTNRNELIRYAATPMAR